MQIVYHLGAHHTDDEQLLKCLLKNKGVLAEEGIVVPGPSRYRPILRETLKTLAGAPASPEVTEVVLGAAMDVDHADRLVFSNENFICVPQRVLTEGRLYPSAGEKTSWLRNVFPEYEVEFHLATRNPATFIPTNLARMKGMSDEQFLGHFDPMELRWSDVVENIRAHNPESQITVWCNEDTPLIWPEVLREVSGHDAYTQLEGVNRILETLMSEQGSNRMEAYLKTHPPESEVQRRRIVAAFLEKFGLEEELEQELDLPGWTEDYVEQLTAQYEEDIYSISRIPGVHLIEP